MGVILGVIFHFIGGFASGSFYMPYKKVRGWHWESYWIIGGVFSWLVVPPLAAWLTSPDNELFVKSQVNFVWYHLMGKGLVDPVDDLGCAFLIELAFLGGRSALVPHDVHALVRYDEE